MKGWKTLSTKLFEKSKVFIGMIMGIGLLFGGHNSVKAVQEEYTAGSSMKVEYEGRDAEIETGDEDNKVDNTDEYGIAMFSNGGWKQDGIGWWYEYPDGSYPASTWRKLDGKWYYFNSKGYWVDSDKSRNCENGTIKGIDVSYYQGNIDWAAVKNDGIKFAMLRVSASYYSDTYHHFTDKKFKEYASNANSVGMPIGAYIYSKARNTQDAISDAQYVVKELQGYAISYPIAIDLEDESQTNLSKWQIGAIAKAFCDEIRKYGYTPMVYCNENWYKNYIDVSQISKEEMWVARYNAYYDENIPRTFWQSSSTSRVAGISGNVDIDFANKAFSSWRYNNGKWSYIGTSGELFTGWHSIGGKWYLFNSNGIMLTGWQKQGKNWYYLDENGAMRTGWLLIKSNWYYLNKSGEMFTGWHSIGGKWYLFNTDGIMLGGWQKQGENWYYLSNNGEMLTGWRSIRGKWYLFNSNGVMLSGWQKVGGEWYLMNKSGEMLTGWQKVGANWYYMNASGVWLY